MQRKRKSGLETSFSKLVGGKTPKNIMCEEYIPKAKLVEFYLRFKNDCSDSVTKIIREKNVIEICGFQNLDIESGEIVKGFIADISKSNEDADSIAKSLQNLDGFVEASFSDNVLNGLIIDRLFFPLLVGGERSFTLRVESFGAILKRLYEKFGTGAAVILYEMGISLGESKIKGVLSRYGVDKQTALKIVLAERSAKGWCMAELEDFNSREAVVVVRELFECMLFRNGQNKPVSQFFRGYLAGLFQYVYGKEVSITETRCIAKGDDACTFTIQVSK
ncbi:MAG: V4R domain-containing protein [Thermoproteota archaeon]